MANIFLDKMRSKSALELIKIIQNKADYNPDAVEAAIIELDRRELIDSNAPHYEDKLLQLEKKVLEIEKRHQADKQSLTSKHQSVSYAIDTFRAEYLLDLVSLYSAFFVLHVILSFPYFNGVLVGWSFIMISLVGIWQVNLLANKANRRTFHIYARLIQSFFITLIISIRSDIILDESEWDNFITFFILILVITGFTSLLIYFLVPPFFVSKKYYFLHKLRAFLIIGPIVLLTLLTLQNSWFIEKDILVWDEDNPFTAEHFNGYPNFFTHYDAAISSEFEYEFEDNGSLKYLRAICNTDQTWINPWSKDSYFLLQHERYHFHITEWAARMARKKIYDTLKLGADEQGVELIIKRYTNERNRLQNLYDDETDHSVISDEQARWQYKIDSALMELDHYWSSDIFQQPNKSDTLIYSRELFLDAGWHLQPGMRLMPSEEEYTAHYRFFYDENKRLESIAYHFQGHPSSDPDYESSIIRINYEGDTEWWTFYDSNDQKHINSEGYASLRIERKNSELNISFFDLDDEKCNNYRDVHSLVINLDKQGRKKRTRFFNLRGVQIPNNKNEYDLRYEYTGLANYPNQIRNYAALGTPLEDVDGVFEKRFFYDSLGYQLSFSRRNRELKPAIKNGYFIRNYKRNELGIIVQTSYHDEHGALRNDNTGVAKTEWPEDRYGNINRKSTYNENNVLFAPKNEVATVYKKYDNLNNLTMIAEYGTGDDLVYDDSSWGKVLYEYDSLNRTSKLTNLNAYDYPVKSDNYGRITLIRYDSLGLIEEGAFQDVNNNPDTAQDGSASYRYTYDSRNNLLKKEYFDLEGNAKAVVKDVSKFEYSYDQKGNKLEARFFNELGNLAQANDNISINLYSYDSLNQMIERSYYDSSSRLTPLKGAAKIKWKYDNYGNQIEVRNFGVDDLLLDSGRAVIKKKFNINGKIVEERYFDSDLNLLTSEPSIITYQYDRFGNHIETAHYNHEGFAAHDREGVHRYQYYYNHDSYLGREHYDIGNRLVGDIEGIAAVDIIRDNHGNVLEERYYDTQRMLTNDTLGVASISYKRDLYYRVIQENYFDHLGKPALRYGKYHEVKYKKTRSGDITETRIYDDRGNLVEDEDGIALYQTSYSRNGGATTKKFNLDEAAQILDPKPDSLSIPNH